MADRIEYVPLFFEDESMLRMLAVLCRSYAGQIIVADGDNDVQKKKAVAYARESGLPLILVTAKAECTPPAGIHSACLERPFLFSRLRELMAELCGTSSGAPPVPRPHPLRWEKENRTLHLREHSVFLTEREAALFDLLWRAAPGFVPEAELRAVFQRTDGNGPQVYITYLRRKLNQLPLSVHITSRRGKGYALLIPEDESL